MSTNDDLFMIVASLQARLGRLPTEEEVIQFIFGSKDEREEIWNGSFD